MHKSMLAFLINDNLIAVEGKYEPGGKVETFKTLDADIRVGDMVVVESTTRHDMTTVKISAVDVEPNLDSEEHCKWVIQRIDADAFDKVLEMEAEAIAAAQAVQRRKKKEELREAMFADDGDQLKALALAHGPDDVVELETPPSAPG